MVVLCFSVFKFRLVMVWRGRLRWVASSHPPACTPQASIAEYVFCCVPQTVPTIPLNHESGYPEKR